MSFKSAREKAGLSQSEVAQRLHVRRSSVNAWDKGHGLPKSSRLLEVAAILNCSVEEILRGN